MKIEIIDSPILPAGMLQRTKKFDGYYKKPTSTVCTINIYTYIY